MSGWCPILPQALGTTASPTFADLTLSGLTASQALMTDVNKKLISVDYLDQAVKTTSSPTFAAMTVAGSYTITKDNQNFLSTISSGTSSVIRLYKNDTTNALANTFQIRGMADITDNTNFEQLVLGWISSADGRYLITTRNAGTGVLRPLSIQAGVNENQLYLATNGRVGIGTDVPSYALHVAGTVYGINTTGIGVAGESDSGIGVAGSSATSIGVAGTSDSGIGVAGSSATSIGVAGTSDSGYGVFGYSATNYGVYGYSDGGVPAIYADGTFYADGLSTLNGGISIGAAGNIAKATNDLTITTAAGKTLVLSPAVYKDINISGVLLSKPASSAPGTDTFRTSAAADTGIETYAFDVGEKVHGGFEIQHDYKEGTDLVFHVHWQGIAAPTGTDYVQWRLTYIVARDGVTLAAVTTIDSPDVAIDTRYRFYRNDFAAIVGTNFKIGDQFMFTLERVAADGDAYAGDCLIATAGIHYQVDTLGSRTIGAK